MIIEPNKDDLERLLDLIEIFWGDTIYSEDFCRDHASVMVNLAIDQGISAIYVDDLGEIRGFILNVFSTLVGSPKALIASEVGFYIQEAYRGNKVAHKLLQKAEELCIDRGVKYLNLVSMESSHPHISKNLYEGLGYRLVESTYSKKLFGE